MDESGPAVHPLLRDLALPGTLAKPGQRLTLRIDDGYLTDDRFELPGFEGLAIQRLLTLAHTETSIGIEWDEQAAKRVMASPAMFPLAAVALCLNNAEHYLSSGREATADDLEKGRVRLLGHRFGADMFSERQLVVCLDSQRPSLPFDFYDVSSRRLRPETDFESLVDDLVFPQIGAGYQAGKLSKLRLALAVILRELLENTDDHAKTELDGSVIKPNAIRGVLLKRILQSRKMPAAGQQASPPIPCLEFTIFDAGVGYYNSYRRQLLKGQARGAPVEVAESHAEIVAKHDLGPSVPLETEYAVLLKCLGRHSEAAIPDPRPGHRGMGLYEVLRALKTMHGMLEIRTGRIHGYRSFLDGELQLQLEPESSETRPGMPKASLLDVDRKLTVRPSMRELVRGCVVRVVVPLA